MKHFRIVWEEILAIVVVYFVVVYIDLGLVTIIGWFLVKEVLFIGFCIYHNIKIGCCTCSATSITTI